MKIAVCLPFYRNFDCLKTMLPGIKACTGDLVRFYVHVADFQERTQAVEVFSEARCQVEVASHGPVYVMADTLNHLFNSACDWADWFLFTEQDVFMHANIGNLIRRFEEQGIPIAGPLDTMFYDHPNAINMALYGEYARLSPQPGYFHSSLIFAQRAHLGAAREPFSIPAGFQMHGSGVLGGETYYGLRINHGEQRNKLRFFRQLHADYGLAADIYYGKEKLATHLYYSSTRHGYRDSKFLSEQDYNWLGSEEKRFIEDYHNEHSG